MALFLVQHGKSRPREEDPARGLSTEGREEVALIAAMAKDHGVVVSVIRHSGKTRARQTAEIFSNHLAPGGGVHAATGLAPLDDVAGLDLTDAENLMLVGHLPFMEKLTTYLITGSAEGPRVFKFQNGGIVCLEKDPDTRAWFIKWSLSPRIG